MHIISALFTEDIQLRQVPGPSTRIDLTGIQFSAPAPGPFPVEVAPHLVVFVYAPVNGTTSGALVVEYKRGDEVIARNAQPLQVEPGRFQYRLVRGELEFSEPGVVFAHCRIDNGPETVVPYTLLAPVEGDGT